MEHVNLKAFLLLLKSDQKDKKLGITEQDMEDAVFNNRVRQRISYRRGLLLGIKKASKPKVKVVRHPPYITVI